MPISQTHRRDQLAKFTLPKPPSINHIYGYTARSGFARSYITKEGIDWFTNGALLLKKKFKRKVITDPVEIDIELYHHRKQDVDNILKPILDLLSKWCLQCQEKIHSRKGCQCGKNVRILEDDDQVYRLTIEKYTIKKDEEQHINVEIMGYS